MTFLRRTAVATACLLASALPCRAQIYETVGTRAKGMGGAFVAVADDATAVWWNPAGLATGAYFSMVLEHGRMTEPGKPAPIGPAWRNTSSGFSAAFPVMALSYYRLRFSQIRPVSPTETAEPGRQDQGPVGAVLRSLVTTQLGVTVGQSVGRHMVIGSTVSVIRGGEASSSVAGDGDLFGQADDLKVSSGMRPDLDAGAMVSGGHVRLGINVKHVTAPTLGKGDARIELDRQVRAGAAVLTGSRGILDAAAFAVDADLTKTSTVIGDVQHVAGGVEGWFWSRRVGLRAGVSRNTVGPAVIARSSGISLALRRGFYLDGSTTFGNDQSRNGWDVSWRLTF
jgi:hypothetical protein